MPKQLKIELYPERYHRLKEIKANILEVTGGQLDISLKDLLEVCLDSLNLQHARAKIIFEWREKNRE